MCDASSNGKNASERCHTSQGQRYFQMSCSEHPHCAYGLIQGAHPPFLSSEAQTTMSCMIPVWASGLSIRPQPALLHPLITAWAQRLPEMLAFMVLSLQRPVHSDGGPEADSQNSHDEQIFEKPQDHTLEQHSSIGAASKLLVQMLQLYASRRIMLQFAVAA